MSVTFRVQFELDIANVWIEDGFWLTPDRVREIIQENILQYAQDYEKEMRGIVVSTDIIQEDIINQLKNEEAKEHN